MNSPTPSAPKKNIDESFLHLATKQFKESYEWLSAQYDKKCMMLAQYADRAGANNKYVLAETAFLTAFHRYMQNVRKHETYLNIIMQQQKVLIDQIRINEKIFALHGISRIEVERYFFSEKMLDEDLAEANKEKTIRVPMILKNRIK